MRCGYYDGARRGRRADRRRDRDGRHRARSPEQVLGLPTRRGAPTKIGGLVDVVRSPAYSTGVGLVMFGAEQGGREAAAARSDERPRHVQARVVAARRDVLTFARSCTRAALRDQPILEA